MTNRKIVIVAIGAIVAVMIVAGLTVWIGITRSPKTVTNFVFFGIGDATTEKFPLEKGTLWLVITTCGENRQHCSIRLIDNGEDEFIFHTVLNVADVGEGGTPQGMIYEDIRKGDYRFDIKADCRWTISVIQPVPENREFFIQPEFF